MKILKKTFLMVIALFIIVSVIGTNTVAAYSNIILNEMENTNSQESNSGSDENAQEENVQEDVNTVEEDEEENIQEDNSQDQEDEDNQEINDDNKEDGNEDTDNDENIDESVFSVKVLTDNMEINEYIVDDIYYLFIPNGIDLENLEISYSGKIKTISGIEGITFDNETKTITNFYKNSDNIEDVTKATINITTEVGEYTIIVMQSDLPSMSITLNDTTLDTINSGSKSTKYKGNSLTLNTETETIVDDSDVEVKGRGNFSWTLPKRSYQIKLSSKVNILDMGKAKTWLLIANYADASLMRNKLTYDLASEMGMPYTQNAEWIDLWVDGEYQGNYLLVEKIQVNTNRVELTDDYGIIVEMDNNYYASEDYYFTSKETGSHFVLHDSVAEDKDLDSSYYETAFKDFEDYINEFESLLYDETKDWSKISAMIDVESFIKYYFIQEFTANADGARTSVFMYKDGADDVLHMGPVWDFDLSLANCDKDAWGGNANLDYIMDIDKYMVSSLDWYTQLFTISEFREQVSELYNNEIKDVLATAVEKISDYEATLTNSAAMNFIKWDVLGGENPFGSYRGHQLKETYAEEVAYLSNWVQERVEYLNKRYSADSSIINVKYNSHVQDYGWEDDFYYSNGETSGTTGQNKKVEAVKIMLDTFNQEYSDAIIKYQTYVEGSGWQEPVQNGETSGTIGQNLKVYGIKISLENLDGYSVEYRVHVQDVGWLDWVEDGELAGLETLNKKIEAIEIKIVEKLDQIDIAYNSHIQDDGWEDDFIYSNGEQSGTTGQNKKIEAVKIKLTNAPSGSSVRYKVYLNGTGWQEGWSIDGEMAGTTRQNRKMEAIRIDLQGLDDYSVKYRVHVQDIGWMDWVYDGDIAGVIDQELKIEAIEIKVVRKIESSNVSVSYRSHVQDYGWETTWTLDGNVSGTTGKNKKVEATQIYLQNSGSIESNIKYQLYVDGSGWQDWIYNSQIGGTTGQNRKVYGIKIELENLEEYSVKYRVHVQDVGWLDWVSDGELAGLETLNKKIEAIQIQIIKK